MLACAWDTLPDVLVVPACRECLPTHYTHTCPHTVSPFVPPPPPCLICCSVVHTLHLFWRRYLEEEEEEEALCSAWLTMGCLPSLYTHTTCPPTALLGGEEGQWEILCLFFVLTSVYILQSPLLCSPHSPFYTYVFLLYTFSPPVLVSFLYYSLRRVWGLHSLPYLCSEFTTETITVHTATLPFSCTPVCSPLPLLPHLYVLVRYLFYYTPVPGGGWVGELRLCRLLVETRYLPAPRDYLQVEGWRVCSYLHTPLICSLLPAVCAWVYSFCLALCATPPACSAVPFIIYICLVCQCVCGVPNVPGHHDAYTTIPLPRSYLPATYMFFLLYLLCSRFLPTVTCNSSLTVFLLHSTGKIHIPYIPVILHIPVGHLFFSLPFTYIALPGNLLHCWLHSCLYTFTCSDTILTSCSCLLFVPLPSSTFLPPVWEWDIYLPLSAYLLYSLETFLLFPSIWR